MVCKKIKLIYWTSRDFMQRVVENRSQPMARVWAHDLHQVPQPFQNTLLLADTTNVGGQPETNHPHGSARSKSLSFSLPPGPSVTSKMRSFPCLRSSDYPEYMVLGSGLLTWHRMMRTLMLYGLASSLRTRRKQCRRSPKIWNSSWVQRSSPRKLESAVQGIGQQKSNRESYVWSRSSLQRSMC